KCPLRNKGDRLAREGTGARRLVALPSPRSRGEGA
ncbi:redox-sensitive transcriptional activator SoxR, partial [Mesorhizobium sp. M7A.F.Ca.CA.001.13.2.1]